MDTDDSTYPVRSSSLHWRLAAGIQVHQRTWNGETTVYIDPIGETMVVNELGAAAIRGICAGRTNLATLQTWCQERGLANASEDVSGALSSLVASLAEFEIIELDP